MLGRGMYPRPPDSLPQFTAQEEQGMKKMNPKTPEDLEEEL